MKWGNAVESTELYYDEIETPIGPLLILGLNNKVVRLDFGTMSELENKLSKWCKKFFNRPIFIKELGKYSLATNELCEYFAKKRKQFTFEFKLLGTPFQQKVWRTLYQTTPYGQTRTYQDLAIMIDHPKAVRAIGGAMNKNPISIVVPCHRVIGKNGQLIGYGGGLNKKQFLLRHEESFMN